MQYQLLEEKITELTGIDQEMLAGAKEEDEVLDHFFGFLGEDILVGQNVIFDYSFLKQAAINRKMSFERKAADTLKTHLLVTLYVMKRIKLYLKK